jgi:hypothetical protein
MWPRNFVYSCYNTLYKCFAVNVGSRYIVYGRYWLQKVIDFHRLLFYSSLLSFQELLLHRYITECIAPPHRYHLCGEPAHCGKRDTWPHSNNWWWHVGWSNLTGIIVDSIAITIPMSAKRGEPTPWWMVLMKTWCLFSGSINSLHLWNSPFSQTDHDHFPQNMNMFPSNIFFSYPLLIFYILTYSLLSKLHTGRNVFHLNFLNLGEISGSHRPMIRL